MNSIHTGKNGGFASVIGQQEAVSMILQTMRAGRLPHAIMVCGPSGCGKLPFAMALARYVCCTNPSDNDSCGECMSCRMADKLDDIGRLAAGMETETETFALFLACRLVRRYGRPEQTTAYIHL